MSYAKTTTVPISKTQDEIRRVLTKHGANGFAYAEQGPLAIVAFEMMGRRIKFILPMPTPLSKNGTQASIKNYEQLCRSKWRCLLLAIKAKLECVESGITTLEQEFLAHIVLPNGQTMGQVAIPQIAQSYSENKMPPLLGYE